MMLCISHHLPHLHNLRNLRISFDAAPDADLDPDGSKRGRGHSYTKTVVHWTFLSFISLSVSSVSITKL